MRFRWLALTVLAMGLGAGSAMARQADVLTGRVLGEDGRPLVGARVEVMSVESEITRSVLTSGDGRYMLLFPDGGGRYLMRITFLGMADVVQVVMREAEEELLLTNVTMAPQAIQVQGIDVAVQRNAPQAGTVAERSTELSPELLNRLPLPDLDPTTLALLAEGVVPTSLDSITGLMGFSVAGMSDLLNQITLDGMILGGDGLGVPELGLRQTQVTTSTFDVSRGGFAGGQVAMTTARGNNRASGAFTYRLDDDALQIRATPTTNAFTRQNIGASWGGPLVQNRLFYNVSGQFGRNTNHRFALAAGDPLAAYRSGVDVDSIARFLDILEYSYGIPTGGQTGAYRQLTDDIRLQARMDWNALQRQGTSQTLSLRTNLNLNLQDSTRINTLDLTQHGGDMERNSHSTAIGLSSRFGGQWTNQLNFSFGENWSETLPFIEMPQGQVRVTSEFEDGTRGSRTLVFGGNRSMPAETYSRNIQLSNDLSFLQPIGNQLHRLKVGGSLQHTRDVRRSTDNLFGTFTFASLADFEANNPERYERSLTERDTRTGRFDLGLYVGDTWRVSTPLELTLGLRWDYSRLDQRPEYNPVIEDLFGMRTDINPVSSAWSPRLGFNYRLNRQGQPARALSGGAGYFAGRPPTNIFSTAVRQTGLPEADQRLVCIGSAVPVPDWDLYLRDPAAVPSTCADGGMGAPVLSSRAPAVTLIDPDQSMPSSLRLDLGYRTQLPLAMTGNFRYQFSQGLGLWQYRDINLNETPGFHLAQEGGRPFFGDASAVVPRTGTVSSVASRVYPELANVYEVTSTGRSTAHQFTARINGFLPLNMMFNANYTLGFSRDQGDGSFAQSTTAANPNQPEWGTSNNDRRHNLNLMLAYPITSAIDISLTSRITSGAPFTPLVNRDINGDGARNDRAFIFDPFDPATDPAVATSMLRLLDNVPGGVRECIESQFGTIASRNSCRNGWNQTLDMRANFSPVLPGLQRRMTLSLDARNVLTGLDQLINGKSNMRGWGEGQRADANLLEVRGFDAAAQRFLYEVNEGFGQTNRGPNAFRNAFSITLSGRVALGAAQQGGGRGGRGGGGFGGGIAAFMGGGGRGGAGGPGGVNMFALLQGGPAEVEAATATMLPNPLQQVVALRDSLRLDEEQVRVVSAMADTLEARLTERRKVLAASLERMAGSFSGGQFSPQMKQSMQSEVQPQITAGNNEIVLAMRELERQLGPEQWALLPANLRNMAQGVPGGGGLAGGFGGRGGGGFNAVGMMDRMLANPIPVLLELKDTLKLTAEQVAQIQQVSAALQEKLNKRREELGRRFDNVQNPQQQAQLFQQMQPELDAGRQEITEALREVERILTPAQWQQLPAAIRDPFQGQPTPGQGQGQRQGGRGGRGGGGGGGGGGRGGGGFGG